MTEGRAGWLFEEPHKPCNGTEEGLAARVAFPVRPRGLFGYLVPEALRDEICRGLPVRVPLGKSGHIRIGYCVDLCSPIEIGKKLKSIQGLASSVPSLPEDLIRLGSWMVDYYVCDWAEVLQAIVPGVIREGPKSRGRPIARLSEVGRRLVEEAQRPPDISPTQWRILEHLSRLGPTLVRTLTRSVGCSTVPITTLRKRGLIIVEKGELLFPSKSHDVSEALPVAQLTAEQAAAFHIINQSLTAGSHQVILVHGITGSGKTELYLRAAAEIVSRGFQVIYLVPEISLTPQIVERLRARFHRVAILHSHLSQRERRRAWQEVRRGEISVVLGARSAVFAPTPKLGLIIIDEEHEWSFKQEAAPRYHAREVAIARAQIAGIPVILGSATPSLETLVAAKKGIYRMVELRKRVHGRPLPQVDIIDLRDPTHRRSSRSIITAPLYQAVHDTLNDGGQVLLLHNRRGFAAAVLCPLCGFVMRCPECDIALTYHRTAQAATCHYCAHEQAIPTSCPQCQGQGFHFLGFGTQRLESELQKRFPKVSVARMDADAMRPRGTYEKTLKAFQHGDVQVLVGTQLIAKGLDFPNVALVGVVYADLAIHFPDFRAGERTFQLLTQVAGRTGRGDRPGKVLIQTYCPSHPVILAASKHAYEEFAARELDIRARYGYPPFSSAVRFVVRAKKLEPARMTAERIAEVIKEAFPSQLHKYRLLGPAPCFLHRLHGRHRFHLLILADNWQLRRQMVKHVEAAVRPPQGVVVVHDIDPIDML